MKTYALIKDGKTIDSGSFREMQMKALEYDALKLDVYEINGMGPASYCSYFRICRTLKNGKKQEKRFYTYHLENALFEALKSFSIKLQVKKVLL